MVSVPFRVPVAVGWNVACIAQLFPGVIGLALAQLSDSVKSPLAATLVIESTLVPVFVTVIVCGVLDTPTTTLPKFQVEGESPTPGAMPVPESSTTWTPALSLMISEPLSTPVVEGANATDTPQVPAGATLPQVFVSLKSPVATTLFTVTASAVLFVSVRFCAALVVPTTWLPKLREPLEGLIPLSTSRFAVVKFPAPPFAEVTVSDTSVYPLEISPTTLTISVQLLFAATLAPPSVIVCDPGCAATVPPQLSLALFGVATASPIGRILVRATPARAVVFAAGFVIVNISVLVPSRATGFGEKAAANTGGATPVRLNDAGVPAPSTLADAVSAPPATGVARTDAFPAPSVVA